MHFGEYFLKYSASLEKTSPLIVETIPLVLYIFSVIVELLTNPIRLKHDKTQTILIIGSYLKA